MVSQTRLFLERSDKPGHHVILGRRSLTTSAAESAEQLGKTDWDASHISPVYLLRPYEEVATALPHITIPFCPFPGIFTPFVWKRLISPLGAVTLNFSPTNN